MKTGRAHCLRCLAELPNADTPTRTTVWESLGLSDSNRMVLVGALAIVRFRTVVDDTRDIAFVIYAVVTGMAAGGGLYWEAALVTPLVMLATWVLRPAPIPKPPVTCSSTCPEARSKSRHSSYARCNSGTYDGCSK